MVELEGIRRPPLFGDVARGGVDEPSLGHGPPLEPAVRAVPAPIPVDEAEDLLLRGQRGDRLERPANVVGVDEVEEPPRQEFLAAEAQCPFPGAIEATEPAFGVGDAEQVRADVEEGVQLADRPLQRRLGLPAPGHRLGQLPVQPEDRDVPPRRHEDDDGQQQACGDEGDARRRPVRHRPAVPPRVDFLVRVGGEVALDRRVQTLEQGAVVLAHGDGPRDLGDGLVHHLDVVVDARLAGELPERRRGTGEGLDLPREEIEQALGEALVGDELEIGAVSQLLQRDASPDSAHDVGARRPVDAGVLGADEERDREGVDRRGEEEFLLAVAAHPHAWREVDLTALEQFDDVGPAVLEDVAHPEAGATGDRVHDVHGEAGGLARLPVPVVGGRRVRRDGRLDLQDAALTFLRA